MLSKDDVIHIAKLARLRLTKEEQTRMQKELSAILDYVGQLEEVDTESVAITAQVTGLHSETREDEVVKQDAKPGELLATSPLPIVEKQIRVPSAHS